MGTLQSYSGKVRHRQSFKSTWGTQFTTSMLYLHPVSEDHLRIAGNIGKLLAGEVGANSLP